MRQERPPFWDESKADIHDYWGRRIIAWALPAMAAIMIGTMVGYKIFNNEVKPTAPVYAIASLYMFGRGIREKIRLNREQNLTNRF